MMRSLRASFADIIPHIGTIAALWAWLFLVLGIIQWNVMLLVVATTLGFLSAFWQWHFERATTRRIKETDFDRARQVVDRLSPADRAVMHRYLDQEP